MKPCGPAKILMFHDVGTRSHLMCYFPLAEELLHRGHQVTGVFYRSAQITHPNYTEVLIPDIQGQMMKNVSALYMEDTQASSGGPLAIVSTIWKARHLVYQYLQGIRETLNSPHFQNVLKQQFDVQISTSPSSAYTSEVLDIPLIFLSPPGPFKWYTAPLGNPFNPATSPYIGRTYTDFSFSERFSNTVSWIVGDLWMEFLLGIQQHYVWSELGKGQFSWTTDWTKYGAVVLSNSHAVTHDPQAFLENVVHVGGLHIKETKPLPTDLQSFMDAAPQGVVLVSFGSSLTPSSMSADTKQEFIEAFRELELPVIWKWDEDIKDLPANVLVSKWLPQPDLLAHPNLKVFVTHGGLLSAMEAIYHRTLLVGVPIANDQRPNILRMVENNIGVLLELNQLNSTMLVEGIRKTMTDRSMSESMERMSSLFRDRSQKPVDKAAWWVEFVIRNKGADFLKPKSINMSWYKLMNLDILLVCVLVSLVSICISFKMLKLCCGCCCRRRKLKSD